MRNRTQPYRYLPFSQDFTQLFIQVCLSLSA